MFLQIGSVANLGGSTQLQGASLATAKFASANLAHANVICRSVLSILRPLCQCMAESILRLAVRDGAIREGELLSWTSVCSRVTSVQLRGPRGRKAAVPIRLNERPFTLFHHPEADRLLSTKFVGSMLCTKIRCKNPRLARELFRWIWMQWLACCRPA